MFFWSCSWVQFTAGGANCFCGSLPNWQRSGVAHAANKTHAAVRGLIRFTVISIGSRARVRLKRRRRSSLLIRSLQKNILRDGRIPF
jgi:hypothetical protein